MNAFEALSATLTTAAAQRAPDPIDKNDILNFIDNNLITLKSIVSTCDENSQVMAYLQTVLSQTDNADLKVLYLAYTKQLATPARSLEKLQIFRSIQAAAKLTIGDHERLRDQFADLFNQGTDIGDITIDQMKLSHAAIIGYLNLASIMADWFCFFYTAVAGCPDDLIRVPRYRENVIRESSARVADFVNDVLLRGTSRDFLSVIQSIRRRGDVALYTKAATLDTYANINDYPGISRFISTFNVFQPILWVREFFTTRTHLKYKRNIALRDWMVTKTAILKMDLQKSNSDSPEYIHMQHVLQKYSDLIADLDRRINAYLTQ